MSPISLLESGDGAATTPENSPATSSKQRMRILGQKQKMRQLFFADAKKRGSRSWNSGFAATALVASAWTVWAIVVRSARTALSHWRSATSETFGWMKAVEMVKITSGSIAP